MEKTTWLLQRIKSDATKYPHLEHLTFNEGEMFHWNHSACAITYDPVDEYLVERLLHEYGHAALNHTCYLRDIELIVLERSAWEKATAVAKEFGLSIDEELIEGDLDTYRDWLHTRSLCPNCGATGIQTAERQYQCLSCRQKWQVNEAKTCQLRRYKI